MFHCFSLWLFCFDYFIHRTSSIDSYNMLNLFFNCQLIDPSMLLRKCRYLLENLEKETFFSSQGVCFWYGQMSCKEMLWVSLHINLVVKQTQEGEFVAFSLFSKTRRTRPDNVSHYQIRFIHLISNQSTNIHNTLRSSWFRFFPPFFTVPFDVSYFPPLFPCSLALFLIFPFPHLSTHSLVIFLSKSCPDGMFHSFPFFIALSSWSRWFYHLIFRLTRSTHSSQPLSILPPRFPVHLPDPQQTPNSPRNPTPTNFALPFPSLQSGDVSKKPFRVFYYRGVEADKLVDVKQEQLVQMLHSRGRRKAPMVGHYLGEFSITYAPVKHGEKTKKGAATSAHKFIPTQ